MTVPSHFRRQALPGFQGEIVREPAGNRYRDMSMMTGDSAALPD